MILNPTTEESRSLAPFFQHQTTRIAGAIDHCHRHGFPVLTHPLLPNPPNDIRFGICRLENALVFGGDFIILSNGELLVQGLVNNPDLFLSVDCEKFWTKTFSIPKCEAFPAFLVGGSDNFGHFLLNYFSRLSYLSFFEELRSLPIITSGTAPQNHYELFQVAGYPTARQIRIRPDQAVFFKKLYVPTLLTCTNPSTGALDLFNFVPHFIQEIALRTISHPLDSEPPRRIYLSRSTARWRRVINEPEVIGCLKKFDFEVIDPGTLTIAEQVRLAQNSEIIAGPIGNNMNFQLFARPQTVIIQFLYNQIMNITPAVADIFDQRYFEIYGTPLKEGKDDMCYDFSVPIEPLESLLEKITREKANS